jgi:anti-sigma regulatory factor (Ser/Thr protein kinase)
VRPSTPHAPPGYRRRPVTTVDTGTTSQASLSIPGQPEHAHAARRFVETTLGADHPCVGTAVLLASELVTNSMLHSDSRLPGQTITVTVTGVPGGARVEVRDAGGRSVPSLGHPGDPLAERGRGLQLVQDLSARWGHRRERTCLITWFEVTAEPP